MKEQKPLDQYLLAKAEEIEKKSKPGDEARAQVAVTMTRRFRGRTISDRFGRFSRNGTGQWVGDQNKAQVERLANMRHLPIVKPAVRANMAAMVTAKVRLRVEAGTKDPRASGAAGVAEGVLRYLDGHRDHWDERLEGRIAQMCQLSWGYFIRSRHNPRKAGERTTEQDGWEQETETLPGEAACAACGWGGMFEGDIVADEASGLPVTVCQNPECGGTAEVVEEPREQEISVPAYKERNAGASETQVVSSYNVRIDERFTQGANLDAAHWFEYHYLAAEEELEADNPGLEVGTPSEWSYPLRWQRALESGDDGCIKWTKQFAGSCEEHEVREISLRPEAYRNRGPERQVFVWKDGRGEPMMTPEGEPVLYLKAGESLIDKYPDGFRFRVADGKLLPGRPEEPGICPHDFRREWKYGGYMPDAFSFWCHPATELETLQNDANNYYTIDAMYRERHGRNNLAYNGQAFEDEAWETDFTPTKQGFDLGEDGDIRKQFAQVQTPSMPHALEGLNFLFEIAPTVGGPQPAAVGAPSPGEPYSAQLLQRQSSLGLLALSQQSKANVKVGWGQDQVRLAQKWPRERLELVRSRFGREWKDQDVEAFVNCDPDRDLVFSYVQGSEIPSLPVEQDLKYREFMTGLANLAAAIGRPEIITLEMIARGAELAGVDLDIGDNDADRRLAESRLGCIREGLKKNAGLPPEEAVAVTLGHPRLRVLPKEHHQTHIDFYADQERALQTEDAPDFPLIECLEGMILRHENKGVENTQNVNADGVAGQAPIAAAQAMMGGGGGQPAPPAEGDPAASDEEAVKAEEEAMRQEEQADADREHQKDLKRMDNETKERIAEMSARNTQGAETRAGV
jgi:hypothetical protein